MATSSKGWGSEFNGEVWLARLRDFLHDCVSSAAIEEQDRLREAVWLLPASGREPAHDEIARIERMIDCGACESAALALLGPNMSFMLSRGANGACLASVIVAPSDEETISEGATIALALLAANVSALMARCDDRAGDDNAAGRGQVSARLH